MTEKEICAQLLALLSTEEGRKEFEEWLERNFDQILNNMDRHLAIIATTVHVKEENDGR